jgi:hypothetical protein
VIIAPQAHRPVSRAQHRRLVREAIASYRGQEVDNQGDAIFAAFPTARNAVAAAVAAQRSLARHTWPEDVPLRVRMGIHSGEPTATVEGYVGIDLHRAARICAAAHGGQILVSQTTRELVGVDLPSQTVLRDLGEHHLKDLAEPQRLFQVVVADLPSHFPPLRSLDHRTTILPAQLTALIGRKRELLEVAASLQASLADISLDRTPSLSRRTPLMRTPPSKRGFLIMPFEASSVRRVRRVNQLLDAVREFLKHAAAVGTIDQVALDPAV